MMPVHRFATPVLKSPLDGVSADAWQSFVAALEVQPTGAVSDSGGLGSYDIRPRRLVELGYASGLRSERTVTLRQVHVCEFVLPWTQTRFLTDAVAQYTVLVKSIRLYYDALRRGELMKPNTSTAGALAVLHRGGTGALAKFPTLFEDTQKLYDAAKEAF